MTTSQAQPLTDNPASPSTTVAESTRLYVVHRARQVKDMKAAVNIISAHPNSADAEHVAERIAAEQLEAWDRHFIVREEQKTGASCEKGWYTAYGNGNRVNVVVREVAVS